MDFTRARDFILDKLRTGLRPELYYHSIDHILDVYNSAMLLARLENLESRESDLLKTAAILHDAGMMNTYKNHEEASIELARLWLPDFDYTQEDIEKIAEMIKATKMPQGATSLASQILCDADLDYLGRDDFFMISHKLRLEWIRLNMTNRNLKEWYQLQLEFLLSHTYFSEAARETRQKGKEENIWQIQHLLFQ
ncbi:MAG: Metal dependent phosphohydrolase [Bacteroidetes bacterium 38_7]|nr:MAG: Metal dependent phosphohydrolase [Bacteroidetes bacterium 38_7]